MAHRIPDAVLEHQHLADGATAAEAPAGVVVAAGANQIDITARRRRWRCSRCRHRPLVAEAAGEQHADCAIGLHRKARTRLDAADRCGCRHRWREGGGLVGDEGITGWIGLRPVRLDIDLSAGGDAVQLALFGSGHRVTAADVADQLPAAAVKHQIVTDRNQAGDARAVAGMRRAGDIIDPDVTVLRATRRGRRAIDDALESHLAF